MEINYVCNFTFLNVHNISILQKPGNLDTLTHRLTHTLILTHRCIDQRVKHTQLLA